MSAEAIEARVLVAEDHPAWQVILSDKVREAEPAAQVTLVGDCSGARAALKGNVLWHLLITDVGLPVESGERTEDRLKYGLMLVEDAQALRLPVLVVSGNPAVKKLDIRNLFKKYGVEDYFTKGPFD